MAAAGFKSTDEDPVCPVFVVGVWEMVSPGIGALDLMLRQMENVDYMLPVRGDNEGEEQERLLRQL
ncbi:hypothetical protein BGX28_001939 [Mortierella sp. GBA30]|nr:hypothetical protein BGX28_001939 [Mortierella sp. GBA30]